MNGHLMIFFFIIAILVSASESNSEEEGRQLPSGGPDPCIAAQMFCGGGISCANFTAQDKELCETVQAQLCAQCGGGGSGGLGGGGGGNGGSDLCMTAKMFCGGAINCDDFPPQEKQVCEVTQEKLCAQCGGGDGGGSDAGKSPKSGGAETVASMAVITKAYFATQILRKS